MRLWICSLIVRSAFQQSGFNVLYFDFSFLGLASSALVQLPGSWLGQLANVSTLTHNLSC